MKRLLIGCEVVRRDIEDLTKEFSDLDTLWLDENLHSDPEILKMELQKAIDESVDYNEIIISYGRCGNAMIGICARNCDIIYSTIDDCISGFLNNDPKLKEYRKCSLFVNRGWLNTFFNHDNLDDNKIIEKYGEEKAKMIKDMIYRNYTDLIYMQVEDEVSMDYKKEAEKVADSYDLELKFVEASLEVYKKLLNCETGENIKRLKKGEVITHKCFDN